MQISHRATIRKAAKKTLGLVEKNRKQKMFAEIPKIVEKIRTLTPSRIQTVLSYCGILGSVSSQRASQEFIDRLWLKVSSFIADINSAAGKKIMKLYGISERFDSNSFFFKMISIV